MAIAFTVLAIVILLAFVWWFTERDRKVTRGVDPTPDDMRRADDGRPDDPFSDYGNPLGPTGNR